MSQEEEWEISFRLKLAEIKNMDEEAKKAEIDFLESVFDAELTEDEWIALYAYNNKRRRK